MKQKNRIFLAVLVSGIMVTVVLLKMGIYFQTNDDRCINEILSGSLTSIPTAHTVYVNYLLALPLTLLYRLTTSLPWYGMSLVLFHTVTYTAILESLYTRCRNKIEVLVATVLPMAFFLINLHLIGQIQYTSTAAFMAIGGYICLLLNENRKASWWLFIIFQFFAFLLRRDAMLMIQPIGMAVWMGWLLGQRNMLWKVRINSFLRAVGGIIAIIVIGTGGNAIAYYGTDWEDYNKFNNAEVTMFDFCGAPSYEDVKHILAKYQVSKATYEAYQYYVILDWDIPPQCAEELAQYAKEHYVDPSFENVFEKLIKNYYGVNYWGMNHIAIAVWIMLIIWMIASRKFFLLWPMAGLLVSRLLVWSYLLYRGRMPMRLIIPLLVCEIGLLMVMLIISYDSQDTNKIRKILLLCMCGVFCLMSVGSGREQYRSIKHENNMQEVYIKGLREIQEYCNKNADNKYLLDAISMSYYKGSALETQIYKPCNYAATGSWYSNSPPMRQYLKKYFEDAKDGFRLIIYNYDVGTNHPTVVYLSEITGARPILEEYLTASHGGVYAIYYFEGHIKFKEEI